MNELQHQPHQPHTQEDIFGLMEKTANASIGFLKDLITVKGIALVSPLFINKIKSEDIIIWMQRNFGIHAAFSDMDYAEAGADIADDQANIVQNADIIVKLEPLTLKEAHLLRPKQLIVSSLDINTLSREYFQILKEKNITAFALDYIEDMDGNSILNNIFYREETPAAITTSLSLFIQPLLLAIAMTNSIRASIQTNPALFQSLYTFNGDITRKEIAQKLDMPWRDFTSLFWNLN
ncbi:hypothetical protein LJC68_05920 [Bacteroidales bacterium OttesenSCG-928-B11]|nr:hypothetical protein [Bacteroidales bacterium OttesenSCG-928-C03]MDL2312395.1 hypothetical protein [Bacteroidales bacterium OttesenSCG-928-B11]